MRQSRFTIRRLAEVAAVLGTLAVAASASERLPRPPETAREEVRETLHGVEMVDPYRWLEDRDSPATRAWIERQNTHTQSLLKDWPGKEQVTRRLTELYRIDSVGTPVARGGSYFFMKRKADQDLSVLCRRKGLDGPDEVLIDPHPLSLDHSKSVSLRGVSRDGSLLAYAVRQGGADETTVQFMEVESRRELPDRLPTARYTSVAIKPDRSGFYYGIHTAEGPRLRYHAMGTPLSEDPEIFGKGYGPQFGMGATLSADGRTLLIQAAAGSAALKTEIYLYDVARGGPIRTVVNDIEARFDAGIAGDRLYLMTDWKAPRGRILVTELNDPGRERWREVVPESKASLESYTLAGGKLFISYLEDVRSRVSIFSPDGKHEGDLSFPTLGSVSGVSGRWESPEAFFSFSSFHIPPTTYRYEVSTGARQEWARLNAPVDPDRFEVKQVWYRSKDGTRVPMFLVHKKGLKLDGARPTLFTGYGGFSLSLTPGFTPMAVVWAEAGGVWAVPNLRGGSEFGEEWHRAGMLAKKQNVFDDFYAAAEWLMDNRYTRPSRLACSGGSNGGLLVGAALTQRPGLFRAVVCSYPLLDMVRYHRFLVARFWVPEYGSSEDPEQFRTLYAYSPYHHVRPGTKYPAVLFVTGDSDTRVAPLHARKMAALLQSAARPGRPVLLHYDTRAGHSGGRPVSLTIADLTLELGFLFGQLDVEVNGSMGKDAVHGGVNAEDAKSAKDAERKEK